MIGSSQMEEMKKKQEERKHIEAVMADCKVYCSFESRWLP